MSVTALLRGTEYPSALPTLQLIHSVQGNSRRFHCPEHQTTGPIPECTNDIPNTCDCLNIGNRTADVIFVRLHLERRNRRRLFQHPPLSRSIRGSPYEG